MDLYCLQSFSTSLQAAEIVSPLVVTLLLIAPDAGIVGYAQLREGPPPVEIEKDGLLPEGRVHRRRSSRVPPRCRPADRSADDARHPPVAL
jgi:hypothetical protein